MNFRLFYLLGSFAVLILFSCNGPVEDAPTMVDEEKDEMEVKAVDSEMTEEASGEVSIVGQWKLTKMEGDKVKEGTFEDCDKNTVWDFTIDAAEPLGDGTEVFLLRTIPSADCEFRDFEAKWTQLEGKVFISTSNVGGAGGLSNAGLFDIVEQSTDAIVLSILGTTYYFEKV